MSVIAAEACVLGDGRVFAPGRTTEQVEYDPYGRCRRTRAADFNRSGLVSIQEMFDFLAGFNRSRSEPVYRSFSEWRLRRAVRRGIRFERKLAASG